MDSFETGLNGWTSGAPNPVPPQWVADNGPGGVGDGWLQLGSQGGAGPGSRLSVFSGPQWAGNYVAAGIAAISFDANNLGSTELNLRLVFEGGITTVTSQLVVLPAHSGWTPLFFSLFPADLVGLGSSDLSSINQFRVVHQPGLLGPVPIAAALGIDNVLASAVPEPGSAALALLGLLGLAASLRRRR